MGLALATGDILRGKYRLEQVLGRGGMGVVHLATHLVIGQRVAIKIVSPSPSEHAYVVARFLREARAAALLESEHVVRILDVDEIDDGGLAGSSRTGNGTPFMVMEYLHGSDLGAILRKGGRLPLTEAVSYVLQACEALAEAHAAGIVHRDLKPSNLFRAETARKEPIIKLLDFGISKLASPGEDLSLTDTQAVIGSPLFMSPEQLLSSRDVDHRTDIWSLGVTLYQLAAGALPFEASSASALGAQIAATAPRALSMVLPEVPRDLEAVVMRCLARAPEDRFSDIVSLARALGSYASEDAVAAVERAAERGARGRRPSLNTNDVPAPAAVEASGERWTQSRVGGDAGPSTPERAAMETRSRERRAEPNDDALRREGGLAASHAAGPVATMGERAPRSVTGPASPMTLGPHATALISPSTAPPPPPTFMAAPAPSAILVPSTPPRRKGRIVVFAISGMVVLLLAVVVTLLALKTQRKNQNAITTSTTTTGAASATPATSSVMTTAPSSPATTASAPTTPSSSTGKSPAPTRGGGASPRTPKPGTTWSKDPSELELK